MKKAIAKVATKKVKTNITKKDLDWTIDLAYKVGDFLIKKQSRILNLKSNLKVHHKEAQGVASEADLGAEERILKAIHKRYPHHEILAEESAYELFKGAKEKYEFLKEKEWVWIIDPLDGTNNFLNGLDYYAICISLVNFGKPVLGVVYRPRTGEVFSALDKKGANVLAHGKSSFKKLKCITNKKPLSECLLVTGFTTEKGEVFDREFDLFKNMMGKSRGIRRMGSAALDLCYVASGIFDAFWERGLAPWDVSAAGLICLEAGICITTYDGEAFHPFQSTIVAARKEIKIQIDPIIRS